MIDQKPMRKLSKRDVALMRQRRKLQQAAQKATEALKGKAPRTMSPLGTTGY